MAEANEREIAIAEALDAEYNRESQKAETLDEAQHRCIALFAGALAAYREELGNAATPTPIPMLLWCPECAERHIDMDAFATRAHHTHACQHCGHVWRPALIPTVGVRFLPGFKNEPAEPEPKEPEAPNG